MASVSQLFMKRINNEIKKLINSKDELAKQGIFVAVDEDNIKTIYVVIFGAEQTPYEYCPFFFKLEIPDSYPHTSPKGTFVTSDGKTRFNPNLYVNGKICLSILGTWQGPGWSSTMNITTVIMSILGLVMNDYPLINEPGYETSTEESKKAYNYYVEYNSLNYALCEQIKNLEPPFLQFKTDIISQILNSADKIIAKIDKLIETNNNKTVICNYCNVNTSYDYVKLKEKVINFLQEL